ncbi:VOC family protein [Flavobacterium sp. P21]|uniref:VOC family protein n=1 Tax=Flavobacterium sp. P21 TaxID=3423948 RepID=UPI003D67DBA2
MKATKIKSNQNTQASLIALLSLILFLNPLNKMTAQNKISAQNEVGIQGIDHVGINVPDLQKGLAFLAMSLVLLQ